MKKRNKNAGFTIVEMLVAVAVLGLLGVVFFQVLNSGLVLYAKNSAVNLAHEEARQGILRITRDIHSSVSVPQLRDSSFNIVSSTPVGGGAPTAAAIFFFDILLGPLYVGKNPNGNGPIMLKNGTNNAVPTPGMHVISPFFG